jgi:thioredoxin 1
MESMTALTLEANNRRRVADWLLEDDTWTVACLCAAWCDTCQAYRATFDALAARHPRQHFIWIDIEDQADVVDDFEVENFPTLLIQRGARVAFFGIVLPELRVAERLLLAQFEKSDAELAAASANNIVPDLRQRLIDTLDR